MNDLERKLFASCLPGLSGIQSLAVYMTGVAVSQILGFTSGTFAEFLVENGIASKIAIRTGLLKFDPSIVERDVLTLSHWLSCSGHGVVFLGDADYPRYLAMGDSPPYRLCGVGSFPPSATKPRNPQYEGMLCGVGSFSSSATISVAGTRTPTGLAVCECYRFGLDAALNGTGIVSALSVGCDQACAQGVVDAGGCCWALLPCGPEYLYPACPRLRDAIIDRGGGLLSPYMPLDIPLKWRFHQRNDALACISPWLVLFQGGTTSGVLLCADSALRQGREVVVHRCGASDIPTSRGTYTLARDGAAVVDGYSRLAEISSELYQCRKSVRRIAPGGLSSGELHRGELSGALYRYRNAWYSSGYGQN